MATTLTPRDRNKTAALFFMLVLWLSFALPAFAADREGTVAWVYDGDTIRLSDGQKIRYIGVNAPEIAHDGRAAEPFGQEAFSFNKSLTLGKRVRMEYDKERVDQYGRLLAYVFLSDGTFVNAVLVEHGLATVYTTPPNVKHDRDLLDLQRRAMSDKKGLWSSVVPGKESFYIGNARSRRFHAPSCPFGKRRPTNVSW